MHVLPGPSVLLDGGNETTVATCMAERGRPAAEVFWESELELQGRSEGQRQDQSNGTTTSQVHYLWAPTRHAQGHTITCVVRHPALPAEVRKPYVLNVQCECPQDLLFTLTMVLALKENGYILRFYL